MKPIAAQVLAMSPLDHCFVRRFVRTLSCGVLLIASTATLAQTPAPFGTPNARFEQPSSARALATQSDGRLVVGGPFAMVNGQPRNGLVRLNTDGTIDPSFTTELNGAPGAGFVDALAVDAQDRIYVAGTYTTIGGVAQANLARLLPDGTVDAGWRPQVNGQPYRIVVDAATNSVFLAGSTTQVNGVPRIGLAKLSAGPTATLDPDWAPNPSGAIYAMAVIGSSLYVGGSFDAIGGQSRIGLAKLSTGGTGSADSVWAADVAFVSALAYDATANRLVVAGAFNTIDGVAVARLARVGLSGTGTVDAAWAPSPGSAPSDVKAGPGDTLYISGPFTTVGGAPVSGAARIVRSTGAVDPDWLPDPYLYCDHLLPLADGTVMLAGRMDRVRGALHEGIARIGFDGEPDAAFTTRVTEPGIVRALATAASGHTYVGGTFSRVDGVARRNLARFAGNGTTLDPSWVPNADGTVYAIALHGAPLRLLAAGDFGFVGGEARQGLARLDLTFGLADAGFAPAVDGIPVALGLRGDQVYVGGFFSAVGGQPRGNLALVDAYTGAVDATWTPAANSTVWALAPTAAGHVFAGGDFSLAGGQSRQGVVRLAAGGNGAGDPGWNAALSPGSNVYAIEPDAAQTSIYLGGTFSSVHGQIRRGSARVAAATGQLDTQWVPGFVGTVFDFQRDPSGAIYAAGAFPSSPTLPRGVVRVDATTGTLDPLWNPRANGNGIALALDRDGALVVGGQFTQIGGQPRVAVALLPRSGATATITGVAPEPSMYGQSYVVQATLASTFATPTGSVTFADGQGHNCFAIAENGVATCEFFETTPGTVQISASYVPDGPEFAPAGAAPVPHTVTATATTTTLVPSTNAPRVGEPVTFAFAVAGGTPTGTVEVRAGESGAGELDVLCAAAVEAGACTAAVDASGTLTAYAAYGGDALHAGSASANAKLEVAAAATSLVLANGPSSAPAGSPFAFEFALGVDAPGGGMPSGTVTIAGGGESCSVAAAPTGTCSLTFVAPGTYAIAATYTPDDADHLESASAPVEHTAQVLADPVFASGFE